MERSTTIIRVTDRCSKLPPSHSSLIQNIIYSLAHHTILPSTRPQSSLKLPPTYNQLFLLPWFPVSSYSVGPLTVRCSSTYLPLKDGNDELWKRKISSLFSSAFSVASHRTIDRLDPSSSIMHTWDPCALTLSGHRTPCGGRRSSISGRMTSSLATGKPESSTGNTLTAGDGFGIDRPPSGGSAAIHRGGRGTVGGICHPPWAAPMSGLWGMYGAGA